MDAAGPARAVTLLHTVRAELVARSDPPFRENLIRFFREAVDPYGVRSAALQDVVRNTYRELKTWPRAERNNFCNALWQSGKLEEGILVCHVYRRFRKECTPCEFLLFERWIDRFVRNWVHCDGVATWLLAASIANEPALINRLDGWTESPNRWKRRASALALLQEAKAGRHFEAITQIASRLAEDPDDMVQKGVGWLLKEAYPKRPDKLIAFLPSQPFSRLTLRYAAEKMTKRDRAFVLQHRDERQQEITASNSKPPRQKPPNFRIR